MKIENLPPKYKHIIDFWCMLSPVARTIVEMRYCQRKTQEDVSKVLKITPERVRQIEIQITKLLTKNKK